MGWLIGVSILNREGWKSNSASRHHHRHRHHHHYYRYYRSSLFQLPAVESPWSGFSARSSQVISDAFLAGQGCEPNIALRARTHVCFFMQGTEHLLVRVSGKGQGFQDSLCGFALVWRAGLLGGCIDRLDNVNP